MELTEEILKEIVDNQENPCISLVIPTEITSFEDKEKVKLLIKNAVGKVTQELQANYEEDVATILVDTINSILQKVDMDHLPKGIGLYVTPGYSRIVSFPFPVSALSLVDSYFDVSHLMQSINQQVEYTVVVLSGKDVRLMTGSSTSFFEIQDFNFPHAFADEYQVHRDSPHSLYNREESQIDHARLEQHFRTLDDLLSKYIKDKPVILLGVKENVALFKKISRFKGAIIGEVFGNYTKHSVHEIKKLVEPVLESALKSS